MASIMRRLRVNHILCVDSERLNVRPKQRCGGWGITAKPVAQQREQVVIVAVKRRDWTRAANQPSCYERES